MVCVFNFGVIGPYFFEDNGEGVVLNSNWYCAMLRHCLQANNLMILQMCSSFLCVVIPNGHHGFKTGIYQHHPQTLEALTPDMTLKIINNFSEPLK